MDNGKSVPMIAPVEMGVEASLHPRPRFLIGFVLSPCLPAYVRV